MGLARLCEAGSGYRAALADMQPLTNRHPKFVVLAFESSGWTDPTVQKLVNVWEQQASRRLGPDLRRRGPAPDTSCPSESQYWNSVSLILQLLARLIGRGPSPRIWMMGGHP